MGSSAPEPKKEDRYDIRRDIIYNPNIYRAVIHNKDETTFVQHDQFGKCYVYNVEHPNYNRAYHQIAVPMASHFINAQGKYLSDS